jgi:small-conductance mechanosensitive channel
VRFTLEAVAGELPWRLQDHPPLNLLREFGSSSVVFDVAIPIRDPWWARRPQSLLNEAIWRAFHGSGITIALPQLDVHFQSREDRFQTSGGSPTP